MFTKNEFKTETKSLGRGRLCAFLNTNWLLVFLLMISCVVACKKGDWYQGKVGICPKVLSTDPLNGAINVVTDKKISATFNEHMNMATVNTSSFQLRHGINQVLGTISYDGTTATFTPTDPLLANTVYTATITLSVRDSANNAMPDSYIWSFNTGNTPTVVLTDPTNGASDVPFSKLVTATFSTNMNPSTINGSSYTLQQGSNLVPGTVTYSGMVATFTPTTPLLPKTVYTGTIKGVTADVLGNVMATDYVWSFATGAIPAVVATDPENATINVVLDKIVTATFNKMMDTSTINTNNFTLAQGNSSVSGTVSYNGKTAMFTPTSPLKSNTVYTGTITTGTKDSAGNNLPANYTWSFTTGNAPVVIATDPTNGATNVPFNKVITASFSTAMNAATINSSSVIVKQGTNTIAGTVTYVGTSAVFVPTNPLTPSTVYTGIVTTGAMDALGNALGNNYSWSFTTTSLPPTIISTDPIDGANNVALNKIVIAIFSKPMDASTINGVNFVIKQGNNQVFGTISYSGTAASFTPVLPFTSNTVYTCTIYKGVKDVVGNALASNYTWSFTTATIIIVPPTVVSTDPANKDVNVALDKDISAKFSEAMDVTTMNVLNFTVKQGVNQVFGTVNYVGTTATFVPATSLGANTVYTCTITTGAKDALGNALVNNYVWTFTTAVVNIVSPIVVSSDPSNGVANVPLDKLISATFSEVMDVTTMNVLNFQVKQGLNQVFGTVSYLGKTATFTPASPLLSNTVYTCTITTGAKDALGNPLLNNYVWSFTSVPVIIISPTVVSTDPLNAATNVPLNKLISATFSTVMDPTTINVFNFQVMQGLNQVFGTVSYVGKTATFTPATPLMSNTVYTCTINTGTKDATGNPLLNNYVWNFTSVPVIIISPTVVSTDPLNAATNVPLNKLISATFSEVMDPTTINVINFQVMQGLNQVFGTVSYVGKTATFTPAVPLISNTVYTCTINTGVKDASGNPLLNNYVWSFTSVPVIVIHPTVTSTVPVNLATNVAITSSIMASFSTQMDPLTLSNSTFTLQQGSTTILGAVTYSGTTATFFPLSNLNTNTNYTATITTNAKNLAGVGLASNYVWTFTTAQPVNPPPSLGSAAIFGAFGGNAGITNQGINTVVNGSIGTTAASTLVTGFHDGTTGDVYTETPLNIGDVTGRIYTSPPFPGTASSMLIAQNGLLDATAAYNKISPAGTPGGSDPGAGELGGLTLAPGVYQAAGGTFKITNGNLTLDAKGDANAVWIFQTASALTVGIAGPAGARSVLMINGGLPKNVFWYVGSAATINGAGGGTMSGTIIASAGVTFSTAGNTVQTVLNGRAISLNGSVTMVNTTINVQ